MSDYRPLDAFLPRAALPPIDLARSLIFLFRRDGERILWASEAARRFMGLPPGDEIEGRRLGPLLPSTQRLRALGETLKPGSPPRLERIPFFVNLRFEPLTCVCRIARMRDGNEALLLTAKEIRVAAPLPAEPDLEPQRDILILPRPADPDDAAILQKLATSMKEPAAWQPPERDSLRFTFDSDLKGVIEAVSSEFAKAVGPNSAAAAGKSWHGIATATADEGAARLSALSASPQPFRSVTVIWPMDDGRIVPIEVSGAPRVVKGELLGLRGFGLVKLSEARAQDIPVPEAVPAAHERAADESAATDASAYERIVETVQAALVEPTAINDPPAPAREATLERLTQQERNAFREIARALGARFEGDEPHSAAAPAPGAAPPDANAGLDEEASEAVPITGTAPEALFALEPLPEAETATVPEAFAFEDMSPEPRTNETRAIDTGPEAATAAPDIAPEEPTTIDLPISSADVSFDDPSDALSLVDHLPIGVLIARGDEAVYANATLLDLLGHDSTSALNAAGGIGKLFGERPGGTDAVQASTVLASDGSAIRCDVLIQLIKWRGAPASLFSFRKHRPAIEPEVLPLARNGGNAALEAQLRARDAELAEYRAMLDTATDGVISLTSDGRMLAVNRSVEALFGYDASALVGERLGMLFASESQAAVVDYLDGLNANGVQSILAEGRSVIGREKQGGRIPLFLTIGRVSSSGKLCAVLRDLTNWKKAEADLTEARRMADTANQQKSQFLAKISHEIRTPMNSIIGFAEVMMDERFGVIGNERYADYLKDIHRSGQLVVSLINDLLDLSKIEAGKADLSFGRVNLNDVVTSCVSMMEPQAMRERVFLRTQLDPALPMVVADERSIRQIVINLLSNSAKFNNPGGQIIISTALTAEREAVVRIKDTGIGMSAEELQLAMQPFRQVQTRRGGGTGLGLPLTKALAEANKAMLKITSARGEGTLAELVFPPTRVLAE